jgi:hypothetical protein
MKVGKDLLRQRPRNRATTQLPGPARSAVPPERLAASDLGVWGRDDVPWLEVKATCVQSIFGFASVGRIKGSGGRKQLNCCTKYRLYCPVSFRENGGAEEKCNR